MVARATRRKRIKQLKRLVTLPREQRRQEGLRLLLAWDREARRRAGDLNAPPVWDLVRSQQIQAICQAVDPTGVLLADLGWVCTEAVAKPADRHLLGGSKPLAERSRVVNRPKASGG
jgi:hypothetical protein